MMLRKSFPALALSLALLVLLMTNSMSSGLVPVPLQYGPRASGVEISFPRSYADLVAGKVDYIGGLRPAEFYDAITRPEINTYFELTFTVIGEAIQSNYTIPSYPNWRNPMNDVNFRKAVFHLVNKEWIIGTVFKELFAKRIDVPIAAPSQGWMNGSLIGANYPYPYSPILALIHLTAGGWKDLEGDGILNYPEGWWGKPGRPNLDPLKYYIVDDPYRYMYAHQIVENLRSIGIPVNEHVVPPTILAELCWYYRDYHLASDGWDVGAKEIGQYLKSIERIPRGRFPPTYLYKCFHSQMWLPEYGGHNDYTPGYSDLDEALEAAMYASSPEESRQACMHAQSLIIDKYALWIPIFTKNVPYASRNLLGTVKFFGSSLWNFFTMISAFRLLTAINEPIKIGMNAPLDFNPLYSMWPENEILWEMIQGHNLVLNPLDPMYEMPEIALDFDVDLEKSLVKWWWRPSVTYIEPITGNKLEDFTGASNVFGMWYVYQTPDALYWIDFKDLHHVRISPTDPNFMECYWDNKSCWFYLNAPGSTNLCIYPPAYKVYPLCEDPDNPGTAGPAHKVFVEGVNMTTPGDLPLPVQAKYAPVEVVSIVQDDVITLKQSDTTGDHDYEIVKGKIHIYKDLPNGAKINVTYWARGEAYGITPGNLPLNETMVGSGPYYLVSLNSTWAYFKANRNYWAETPTLGETDWYWWRIEGPKPRAGYMQINIYDVVVITGPYGTQGRYWPDPAYTPTADLAPSADGLPCKIDIYDVVTCTGNYGTKFWIYP
ncbi:MAG: ABC transporter substrate-binding protein [Candidatus Bathyarchaeia archaeon]